MPEHDHSNVETLRRVIEARVTEIQVGIPAKVVSYDPVTQTCQAQPLVRRAVTDIDGRKDEDLPELFEVPVAWPQGGGFALSFPLAAGDLVTLIATTWNAHTAFNTGEISNTSELVTQSISSVIAIPGWRSAAAPLVDPSATVMKIGRDGEDETIEIDDTEIRIGAGATEAITRDDRLQTELTALRNSFDAHVTSFNLHGHLHILGPSTTATPIIPAIPPTASTVGVAPPAVGATAADLGRVK